MVCGLSHLSLIICYKMLALRGKKHLVADYLCCTAKLVIR